MKSHPLADEFRRLAATLRDGGATHEADIWDRAANRVEAWIERQDGELLDLTSAARVSRYSSDQLRRYLDDGRLTDHGRDGAPRVRRGDLPRKLPPVPTKPGPRTISGLPDLAAEVTGQSG
jgi:hypothetical protein